jgi:chaperone modulatory protein CbpM
MADERDDVLTGYVLDESVTLTLTEVCIACRVEEAQIIELVEEGIIEPDLRRRDWVFSSVQLSRAGRALRLQRDLDINAAGVALVLDLLEELEALRARLGAGSHSPIGL